MQKFSLNGPSFEKLKSFVISGSIPKQWKYPFVFKGMTNSLLQYSDGPCGLMASVQAHMLLVNMAHPNFSPKQQLIEAILNIEQKVRNSYIFCLNFNEQAHSATFVATADRNEAGAFIWKTNWFSDPQALFLFVVSLTALVGPVWLSTYSISDTFITEDHQTNLTFVLLLLTGETLDSFQDNNKVMGGMLIKGMLRKPEIGFLSIAKGEEVQNSGEIWKKPIYPIWVAFYGKHFTVLMQAQNGIFEYNALDKPHICTLLTPSHPFYSKIQQVISH